MKINYLICGISISNFFLRNITIYQKSWKVQSFKKRVIGLHFGVCFFVRV